MSKLYFLLIISIDHLNKRKQLKEVNFHYWKMRIYLYYQYFLSFCPLISCKICIVVCTYLRVTLISPWKWHMPVQLLPAQSYRLHPSLQEVLFIFFLNLFQDISIKSWLNLYYISHPNTIMVEFILCIYVHYIHNLKPIRMCLLFKFCSGFFNSEYYVIYSNC